MSDIEISDYRGDFEDVAEFARRIWISQYGGKMWFPSWDPAFYRWQLGPLSDAPCVAAFDGTMLVGFLASIPHTLRIGASVLPAGYCGWFTIDPMYRKSRLGFRLMDALRRRHEELGLAFSIGPVSSDRALGAYHFWMRYSEAYPGDLQFLFPMGFWIKILSPQKMGQAGIAAWERLAARTLGPLLRVIPHGPDADVRPYHPGDLERCAQLVRESSAGFDWTRVWSPEQLANQLESLVSSTLVLERDGRVQGMVNYHRFLLHGREPLRAALIDLWADENLTAMQRARLLGHLCGDLRARDFDVVVALRSAMLPAQACVMNLFLPQPPHAHMVSVLNNERVPLSRPRTWSLLMR